MARARSRCLLAASEHLYRVLVHLYPQGHRREYGHLMAQAFRDLARTAWRHGGAWGLAALWLRTLADLAHTVPREHLAALAEGGFSAMEDRPVTPLPWWQVALAVLPGLLILAGTWPGLRLLIPLAQTGLFTIAGAVAFLRRFALPLCLVPAIAVWTRTRRFPAWGLTALGATFGLLAGEHLFFLGTCGLLAAARYMFVAHQRGMVISRWAWLGLGTAVALAFVPTVDVYPQTWTLMGVGATLLVALLGLPLAQRHGIGAGLTVVAAWLAWGAGPWDSGYGLSGTVWADAARGGLGLLLVLAPLWVLRARSTGSQAWGLLVPAALALAGSAVTAAIVHTDPGILERTLGLPPPPGLVIGYGNLGPKYLRPLLLHEGLVAVQMLLALAVAVSLYWQPGAWQAGAAGDRTS